ncbi:hypothetical protein [Leuconostoc citreum]
MNVKYLAGIKKGVNSENEIIYCFKAFLLYSTLLSLCN